MLLLAVLVTALQGTDTTVSVRAGSRLELSSFEGDISVRTWTRNAVRVEADHDDETRVEIDQGGRAVSVRARSRYGPPEVTWRLTVPADMALSLSSHSGNVSVTGVKGELSISSVEGNIVAQGGSGFVSLQSVEGTIELTDVTGRIAVSTVDGDLVVRNARGSLKGNTVDGEIRLEGIESDEVDASSVDGGITFEGAIRSGGRYHISSHDGDVAVIAPSISADVSVSTFSGDFESDFPVVLTGSQKGRRMNFTLGGGGARLELESFSGTISLRKTTARKH
jgi:DUF4097 and DUF4098 domain-containing protein YvlB